MTNGSRHRHDPLPVGQLRLPAARSRQRRHRCRRRARGGPDQGGADGTRLDADRDLADPPPCRPRPGRGRADGEAPREGDRRGRRRRTACPRSTASSPMARPSPSAARTCMSWTSRATRSAISPFHLPGQRIAFTADSLMALGCGRVFEGTLEQMWGSLQKFADARSRDHDLFGPRIHRRRTRNSP